MSPTFPTQDLVATAVMLGLVGLTLLASWAAKRFLKVPTEWSRKAVHVGVGVTAAFVPQLFTTPLYPIASAVGLLALLAVTRKLGILRAVHGVRRATSGVIAFPLAGIALMMLTGAHGPLYVLPLLVVAFADAAAALVGRPFGKHKFTVGDSVRSVEGSLTFAAVAAAASAIVLVVDGKSLVAVVAVSLAVAFASTLAEALTQRGWDNLVIPLVTYAVLLVTLEPSPAHVVISLVLALAAGALVVLSGLSSSSSSPTPAPSRVAAP
jgi:phytol kinase